MSEQAEDLVDVEERLRDALAPFRATRVPEGTTQAAVERGRRLRRGRRVATAVTPLVAAAVVVATALGIGLATGRDDGGPTGPSVLESGWRRAAPSPLAPRTGAFVLPLGDHRVLVLGGSADAPCPPAAACAAPTKGSAVRLDGAVYDIRTDSWQRIADSPVPVSSAVSAVVGDTVYLLTQPTQFGSDAVDFGERVLLAWSADQDRWTRLPAPQAQVAGLVALDDGRLLAFAYTRPEPDGARCGLSCTPTDLVFDPATRVWTALPEDPLPGTSARQLLPVPGGAVLFAEPLVDAYPYKPWRMARWDAATNSWTRLPDPGLVDSTPGWFAVGGKLVNPSGETVDAGTLGQRRTGGIYDPATGQWQHVPPFTPPPTARPRSAGAGAGAGRVVDRGGVLDVAARRWSDLPARPGDRVEQPGTAVTPAGLLVEFGGVRAEGQGAFTAAGLSADLWLLRLP